MQPDNQNGQDPLPISHEQPHLTEQPLVSTIEQHQDSRQPHRKFKILLVFISIIFASTVAGWAFSYVLLAPFAGETGSEFLYLLLFAYILLPLSVLSLVAALIGLVTIPLKLRKRDLTKKLRTFAIVNLVFCILFGYMMGSFAISNLLGLNQLRKDTAQREAEIAQQLKEFDRTMTPTPISIEKLQSLLESCSVFGFYYTKQSDLDNDGKDDVESSSTGIVSIDLTRGSTKGKYRIHIADRMIEQTVPMARAVQPKCNGPQFWHDGRYEQLSSDGVWR